jgi:predicted lipoprotein
MIMGIKDEILSIADRVKTLPSDAVLKVVSVFLRPCLSHWEEETKKHHEASLRYPEGSSMRKAAETKYNEAFANWHRLSFFSMKVVEAEKFQTFGVKKLVAMKAAA